MRQSARPEERIPNSPFVKRPRAVEMDLCVGSKRQEGNAQETIQLSHISIRDVKGKETQTRIIWTLMETSLEESQTDSYFPTKWPNGYPKQKDVSDTHIQRRTITKINHERRTALERSVKSISLGGLNRFYVATILALTSAAVWL